MKDYSALRLLSTALAVSFFASAAAADTSVVFPPDAGVRNVRDFGAKGDGVTDDTAAIQQAINEVKGIPDTLYFPDGTYLVSDSLGIFGGKGHSRDRLLVYQGQSEAGTILRLRDRSPGFDDPAKPKILLSVYQGESTGDAMHGYVRNFTFDIGTGNGGAVGLRFMANNTGGIYDVTIKSSDPQKAGKLGLDLTSGQVGPCYVKNVTVSGFDCGVEVAHTFSVVLEHLHLSDQNTVGFLNSDGRTTLRGLKSRNRVPAVRNKGQDLTLVDASLTGGAAGVSAIINGDARLFLRDIKQSGYAHLLEESGGQLHKGSELAEWSDGPGTSLFGTGEVATLRLPIKETPEVPWPADLSKWVKAGWSKADEDISAALQAAIDRAATEGQTTLYIPRLAGTYHYPKLTRPIRVHGPLNRIIGMENIIHIEDPNGRFKAGEAVFTFDGLTSDTLVIERFFGLQGPMWMHLFDNKDGKTVVLRNLGHSGITKKPSPRGEWFIEDVSPSRESTLLIGPGEKCWARQFNPETYEVDMIHVDGGQMWILGLKTEGRTRHIVATAGARVELLGGVSYQSWAKQKFDPPMFTVRDSDASFIMGLYHYDTPFATIVEETQNGQIKQLPRAGLKNNHLSLFGTRRSADPLK